MSMTFTKLFSSITESTIWMEDDSTRLVWITMMAMADRKGRVWASLPGLANRARVGLEAAITAIEKFKQPDKFSRTTDFEGRRVEEIDGGWRLLNYEKYRAVRDEETVKETKREWWHKNKSNKSDSPEPLLNNQQPDGAIASGNGVTQDLALQGVTPLPGATWKPSPTQLRFNAFFGRKPTTRWSKAEEKALKLIGEVADSDFKILEKYYRAKIPDDKNFKRHDLPTLLNNFNGEMDRARNFKEPNCF